MLLAEPPAEPYLPAADECREIDQARRDVAQDDVPGVELGDGGLHLVDHALHPEPQPTKLGIVRDRRLVEVALHALRVLTPTDHGEALDGTVAQVDELRALIVQAHQDVPDVRETPLRIVDGVEARHPGMIPSRRRRLARRVATLLRTAAGAHVRATPDLTRAPAAVLASARLSAMAVEPPRSVLATRYVTALREGGSLPGIVEADDDGLYVVKFRGAAQGPKALVAELLVGQLGRFLGLPVPEIVLARLDPALGDAEPDIWVRELLERSPGLNLGLDFLPGALPFTPAVGPRPDPDLAADVVWFDALVTNVDRTAQNTNLLVWHRHLWLIDHGAALYVHHTWRDPAAHARRPFERIREHVLLPYASSIEAADARQAPKVTEAVLRDLVALVPEEWLGTDPVAGSPDRQREAYIGYLVERLASRAFVEAAEEARRAA
jgi:hypothetical protein